MTEGSLMSLVQAPRLAFLHGEVCVSDEIGEERLSFIAADTVDDHVLAAIRDMKAASGDQQSVVLLYAGNDPEEELRALDAGADDCVLVPFNFEHLDARLRASLARLRRVTSKPVSRHLIDVDVLTHQAFLDGRRIRLSPLEFRLLLDLRRQRGKVIPHQYLETQLWGESGPTSRQALKQLVRRLRIRLGVASRDIVCIPGTGYMLM